MTANRDGDPKASTTILVGLVGAIVVFVIIVGLQALFYRTEQALDAERNYPAMAEDLSRVRADQLERLHSYRWIDQDHAVVGIPIDVAMELVVREPAGSGTTQPSGETGG